MFNFILFLSVEIAYLTHKSNINKKSFLIFNFTLSLHSLCTYPDVCIVFFLLLLKIFFTQIKSIKKNCLKTLSPPKFQSHVLSIVKKKKQILKKIKFSKLFHQLHVNIELDST